MHSAHTMRRQVGMVWQGIDTRKDRHDGERERDRDRERKKEFEIWLAL